MQELTNKITEKNLPKFNKYTKDHANKDAHALYLSNFAGDLATISHSESPAHGYPMGSVVPFCLDHSGNPVILTAGIAQHTKNALANPKTSLMVREVSKNHHIETGWRLTLMGDLRAIDESEKERVALNYFRYYPYAESYMGMHDFGFYRLNVKFARVIMGFGKISWVDTEILSQPSTLNAEDESRIIEHMNEDHCDAMEKYLEQRHIPLKGSAKPPTMVAVNQFGITMSYRKKLHFIAFTEQADDAMAIREQLVKMAKA